MKRKRLTEMFPFLLPLRKTQKKICFYTKMALDGKSYAVTKPEIEDPSFISLYTAKTNLINENTGFDIQYQHNKVYNLEHAAGPMNGLVIQPGEVFSFWKLVRMAEKNGAYKDGLALQNGTLVTVNGGGLCHLSNFLFWLFLHTPLTIVERHAHRIQDFPSPDENEPDGVDATVSEGWLDLKVKNDTEMTFQIKLQFESNIMHGTILSNREPGKRWQIINKNKQIYQKDGRIYETVDIIREEIALETKQILKTSRLYTDTFEIGYPLPEGTEILERKA